MRQLSIISHDQKPDQPGALSSNFDDSHNRFINSSLSNTIKIHNNNEEDIVEEIECEPSNIEITNTSPSIILSVNKTETNYYNNNGPGDNLNCVRF